MSKIDDRSFDTGAWHEALSIMHKFQDTFCNEGEWESAKAEEFCRYLERELADLKRSLKIPRGF